MSLTYLSIKNTTVLGLSFLALFFTPTFAYAQSPNVAVNSAEHSTTHIKVKALMDAEDFKAAIKLLEKTQEAGEDTFEISELLVASLVQRIDQVGMLKKRGLAVKLKAAMEHSLDLNPTSIDARESLIGFHLQAPGIVGGSKDKARELLKGFTNLPRADLYLYEARISRAEKDIPRALEFLDKALATDPQNKDALISKGNIQIEQKDYADAVKTFEICVGFFSDNLWCNYLIGKAAHMGAIETKKGISALKNVLEMDEKGDSLTAHTHYRLGELYARNGKIDAAKASLKRSIDINGLKEAKAALETLN